jgi:hypothetical protein
MKSLREDIQANSKTIPDRRRAGDRGCRTGSTSHRVGLRPPPTWIRPRLHGTNTHSPCNRSRLGRFRLQNRRFGRPPRPPNRALHPIPPPIKPRDRRRSRTTAHQPSARTAHPAVAHRERGTAGFRGAVAVLQSDLYHAGRPLDPHMPAQSSMIAIDVLSPFLTPLKFTLVLAVFITVPWILYQIWAFVAPGLYQRRSGWCCRS